MIKNLDSSRNFKGKKAGPKGFTLIELVVVIIIIGVLASIALPTYNGLVEKSRKTEAYTTLKSILESQKRYALEFETYVNVSTFAGLDINLTTPKYFGFENNAAQANPKNDIIETIATALRKDSPRKFYILIDEASNFTEGYKIE